MGGFFGVASKQDCVFDLFFGIDYHSHLGTRRGGMAVYGEDGFNRAIHNIENAPFRTKFDKDVQEMSGHMGIGCISDYEPQPLIVRSHHGTYALTTVSKINNIGELTKKLFENGHSHFLEMSGGDINATELIAALINQKENLIEGIQFALDSIDGSVSILLMNQAGIYAARDKYGRTPVVIGKKEDAYCITFENFAYKNLIGRAGRMFKHFIGNIYVLAKRPNDTETQLAIPFPEEILGDLDKEKYEKILTREQVAKIDEHDKEMLNLVGNAYKEYKNDSILQAQDSNLLKTIAHKLSSNPEAWECLKYLNYSNPDYWDAALYKILNLQPGAWDAKYGTFVEFVKILSGNWEKTIPELLQDLDDIGIGLDTFFRLELADEEVRCASDEIFPRFPSANASLVCEWRMGNGPTYVGGYEPTPSTELGGSLPAVLFRKPNVTGPGRDVNRFARFVMQM